MICFLETLLPEEYLPFLLILKLFQSRGLVYTAILKEGKREGPGGDFFRLTGDIIIEANNSSLYWSPLSLEAIIQHQIQCARMDLHEMSVQGRHAWTYKYKQWTYVHVPALVYKATGPLPSCQDSGIVALINKEFPTHGTKYPLHGAK